MPKKKNRRKNGGSKSRAEWSPPKSIKKYARSYRCSHCNSRVVSVDSPDGQNQFRINITHDASCPVLRGAITDVHDAIRAAISAGVSACVVADPTGGATDEPAD